MNSFKNLNAVQKLAFTVVILSAITTGTGASQLTEIGTLIGPVGTLVVKLATLLLGIATTVCTAGLAFLTSQANATAIAGTIPGAEVIIDARKASPAVVAVAQSDNPNVNLKQPG